MSLLPYPGLRPFHRDEVDIFFGRDEQVEQLAIKLRKSHFLAVVGPSGCGKSSLIYTGLLNAVEAGFLTDIGLHWRIAILNPGRHPMENLAAALINQAGVWSAPPSSSDNADAASESTDHTSAHPPKPDEYSSGQHDNDRTASLLAILRRGPLGLIEALREQPLPAGHSLLIVVDQFEEIFRYRQHQNRDEADAFVALLLRSIRESEIPVYIVITMRSDFLGDCALFPGLPEALNDSQFLTPRLTREQRRLAITGPAKVFGGEIEPTLVNRLLNDMGTDPDQLPVLQHALMRLWTIATERDDQPVLLTLHDYETQGGWDKTLSNHADQIYDKLTPTQQSIAKILFQSLSERSAKRDIRRPATLQTIANIAEVSIDQVIPIIDAFRRSDCSFLRSSEERLTSETLIDISHESLIRQWERMKGWIKEEVESVEIYRELEQNARQYEVGCGGLLEGLDLLPVIAWKKKKQPNRAWAARYGGEFDRAMQFLARSERRRTWKFIWGTIIAIAVAIGLVWMLQLWLKAELASQAAEMAQKLADKNRKAAVESSKKAEDAFTTAANERRFAKSQYLRNQSASYYHLSTLIGIQVLRDSLPPDDIKSDSFKGQESSEDLEKLSEKWFDRYSQPSDTIWDTTERWVQQRSQSSSPVSVDSPDKGQSSDTIWGMVAHWLKQFFNLSSKHSDQVPVTDSKPVEKERSFDAFHSQFLRDSQDLLPKKVHTLPHNDDVSQVIYSPDGKYLVTASEDNSVKLWDVTDVAEVASDKKLPTPKYFLKLEKSASAVALSPDGKLFVTASDDNTARLKNMSSDKELGILKHDKPVSLMVFSSDGKLLATASKDNVVRLWDVASVTSGKKLRTPKHVLKHDKSVLTVAFSRDGKLLATASDDNTVRLWEVASGKELQHLHHGGAVGSVIFSYDGKRLATASRDKTVRVWSVVSGKELQRLNHNDYIQAVAFSHDGKRLATASEDNIARLWDMASGKELLHLHHDDYVMDVTFSYDDKRLATASRDSTARLWNAVSGKELRRMPHNGRVRKVVFNPAEKDNLATASDDDTARLWDVTSDKKMRILNHGEFVSAVAFSRDGKLLATASGDRTARLWCVASDEKLWHMHHKGSVSAVAFSPNGKLLATASEDKTARLWNISGLINDCEKTVEENNTRRSRDASSKELLRLPHASAVKSVAFSHDSKLLATASNDNTVRLWDVTSGKELREPLRHGGTIKDMAFSPDEHSKYLATASDDSFARLWDVASDPGLKFLKHEKFVSSVTFSSDGKLLATTSDDNNARLWDVTSDEKEPTAKFVLKHDDFVRTAAFSRDGKLLVTASDDNTVRLWNVDLGDLGEKDFGKELKRLPHDSYVRVAIFSPDEYGKYLATADDKIARLWDVASGKELKRLSHGGTIKGMAFSPDGKYLATASDDKAARLWLWQPDEQENKGKLLDDLCASMTSNLSWEQWQHYFEGKPYRRTCPGLLPDVKQIEKQYRHLASQNDGKTKANNMLKELSKAYPELNLWKKITQ